MENKQLKEILNKVLEIVGELTNETTEGLKNLIYEDVKKENIIEEIRYQIEDEYTVFSRNALEEIYEFFCDIESSEYSLEDTISEAYNQWKDAQQTYSCIHCIGGSCELCIHQDCDGENKYCGKYEEGE